MDLLLLLLENNNLNNNNFFSLKLFALLQIEVVVFTSWGSPWIYSAHTLETLRYSISLRTVPGRLQIQQHRQWCVWKMVEKWTVCNKNRHLRWAVEGGDSLGIVSLHTLIFSSRVGDRKAETKKAFRKLFCMQPTGRMKSGIYVSTLSGSSSDHAMCTLLVLIWLRCGLVSLTEERPC